MAKSKIAIIEDDLAIAQMYRLKFESEGYDVELADNGKDGFDLLEEFKPDIVLLDLMMPQMNGDQVLAKMRREEWGKHMPVVILTNLGKEEASGSVEKYGVHSYIVKAEMTPKQVADHVKKVLAR